MVEYELTSTELNNLGGITNDEVLLFIENDITRDELLALSIDEIINYNNTA